MQTERLNGSDGHLNYRVACFVDMQMAVLSTPPHCPQRSA